MNSSHEIEFVLKDFSQRPQQQISHIGGRLPSGTQWKISTKEAMEAIRSDTARYFVRIDGGLRNYLVLNRHPLYGTFLTIAEDTREPTTLLGMPEVLEAPTKDEMAAYIEARNAG